MPRPQHPGMGWGGCGYLRQGHEHMIYIYVPIYLALTSPSSKVAHGCKAQNLMALNGNMSAANFNKNP